MRELSALIVEDDVASAFQIERILVQQGFVDIHRVKSIEAADELLDSETPQLAVVDFMLEGKQTGLELMARLKELQIYSLFITSFEEQLVMEKVIEAQPTFFLRKPVSDNEYNFYIQQIKQQLTHKTRDISDAIFIKDESKLVRVQFQEIFFIQSDGNYCTLYTQKRKFHFRKTLIELEKNLPKDAFVRIHRSYILHLVHVLEVNSRENYVFIPNHKLPIGKKYRAALMHALN
ncbi:MAG: response regulator transcription factor [Saprospiraceae bacterium]|nr:response regulator transcription factor [Saprospiraceae bacterium]